MNQGVRINESCMEYRGVCYDVGTRVRMVPYGMSHPYTGTITSFNRCRIVVTYDDGFYNVISKSKLDKYDIEIITPVYYKKYTTDTLTKPKRDCPPSWEVEVAWIWYIVIMAILTIFKDRWIGWIGATAIFFLWKNGFMNGGKKK